MGAVGIDLGLRDFVTLSSGEKLAPPQYYRKVQQKRRRLARLDERIADQRSDQQNSQYGSDDTAEGQHDRTPRLDGQIGIRNQRDFRAELLPREVAEGLDQRTAEVQQEHQTGQQHDGGR